MLESIELEMKKLKNVLEEAEAIVIGAGAGLSTSAGFTYSGERFHKWFSDFEAKYGFHDMYSGGFYPYDTMEEHWAYWSRYIYCNRYLDIPINTYEQILQVIKEKDYFVLTTNVDHCFQKAGFHKEHHFYTQGDYGLFQCSRPCCPKTYDNEKMIRDMMKAQGFLSEENGKLYCQEDTKIEMTIPTELIPKCPECGESMTMNLRSDDTFVQDKGWYEAAERYDTFIKKYENKKMVYLELGVGYNTPGIIKYPFWRMTKQNTKATYICINKGETFCPNEIIDRSICMDSDINNVFEKLNMIYERRKNDGKTGTSNKYDETSQGNTKI